MIDQTKKNALIEHIKARQKTNSGEILLDPEQYFDGYDHHQCAVCANLGFISASRFLAALREISERPEVSAVFIRFYDYADALESEDSWIGSDSVYLVTDASLDIVRGWFADLEPSEVWEERDIAKFPDISRIPDKSQLVAVWWD